jgi:hypothetical protein
MTLQLLNLLNFLIYEENLIFFFISVLFIQKYSIHFPNTVCLISSDVGEGGKQEGNFSEARFLVPD